MQHIMVDIETLSTKHNAVVLSISAVQFDLNTGNTGEEFEIAIDVKQQLNTGADINSDTCAWWFSQDSDAVLSLFSIPKYGVEKALNMFNEWIESLGEVNNLKLWGNGVTFDNTIIRDLYARCNHKFALPYWCDNDVRTLVTIADINTRNFKFTGIKHNGIDDCKHQINYCYAALKKLKGTK